MYVLKDILNIVVQIIVYLNSDPKKGPAFYSKMDLRTPQIKCSCTKKHTSEILVPNRVLQSSGPKRCATYCGLKKEKQWFEQYKLPKRALLKYWGPI